jgi:hypothetical protein
VQNLIEETPEEIIAMRMMAKFSEKYGGVSTNDTNIIFHDVPRPADAEIQAVRAQIIEAMNAEVVKAECQARILKVMKDHITQTNVQAWMVEMLSQEAFGTGVEQSELADVSMARELQKWVTAMRMKARELAACADPTYKQPHHWPPPPQGWKDFVERF